MSKDEFVGWDREILRLGEVLLELTSEGLGLGPGKLREMTCLDKGRAMVGHYYPYCPQLDRTVGHASHSDQGVLSADRAPSGSNGVGSRLSYGEGWLDVKPVPGGLARDLLLTLATYFR